MALHGPQLIRELSSRERLCFDCPVPGGCNEEDPRCLYVAAWTPPSRRPAVRTEQRRERKAAIVGYMEQAGNVTTADVTATFDWPGQETNMLLLDMRRTGIVTQDGEGKGAMWRLNMEGVR